MPRIKPVKNEEANEETKEIFGVLQKKMGKVINIFATMANSPVTLKAFLSLSESAGKTSLSQQLKEEIALAVAQKNACDYCLSAHSAIAKGAGLDEPTILEARSGHSRDPETEKILKFVQSIVANKGEVSDEEFSSLKEAGVSDEKIVEIIFVTIVNIFTNYFNLIAKTEIDFPKVSKKL